MIGRQQKFEIKHNLEDIVRLKKTHQRRLPKFPLIRVYATVSYFTN